jgi:membrane protease YdiL (CAAX protease family)
MEKIKLIGKAFLIFVLYILLSIYMEVTFKICFNSSNLLVSNLSLILSNIFLLLVISLFFLPTIIEDFKKINKDALSLSYKNWLKGLVIMYISNIIIVLITKDIATNESYNRDLLFDMPIYAISVMVFVAPLIEELIFRLSIKDLFKNKWVYATVSGLIFGLMHLTTATNLLELLYVIPYGSLGFFFAKSVYETDNIWSSMITHMSHNGAIITLLMLTNALGA